MRKIVGTHLALKGFEFQNRTVSNNFWKAVLKSRWPANTNF